MRNQEIYYYDISEAFEQERFSGRFLGLLLEEMRRRKTREILFLCIGTDRSTGDSLGPLTGYKLMEHNLVHGTVFGTLDQPVHAMNIDSYMKEIKKKFSKQIVVAVDASVGNAEHIGYVTLGRGALKPGLGVRKELAAVGDLFITGIVGSSKNGDPWMLQSVRLSMVMLLAECISKSIVLGMNAVKNRVENFYVRPTLF